MLYRIILVVVLLLGMATSGFAQDLLISDVQIEGLKRVEKADVQAAIPIKPGDTVSLDEIDKAVHNIFALGRFDDVAADLTKVQGAKVLTFVVKELPLIRRVSFSGNDELSKKKLRPLVKIRIPSLYSRRKIDESVKEIKKAYVKEGYHAAKIVPEITTDAKNEATLTFNITEGKKVLIKEIKFVGNTVFDKDELMKKIETKEKWWLSWLTDRGAYQEDIMEIDIERIKAAYHDVGYQDVKVKPALVTLVDNDEYLDITIEIDEGPLYRVGKVKVSGDLMLPEEQLLRAVKLQPGNVFSRKQLRDSIEILTDLYADGGYAYANVVPITKKDKDKRVIDLTLDIEQGNQVYIEKIRIHGNTKTRDKVIRREIPVVEGELYSSRKVKGANRRIRNLGFFEEVNVTNKPGSDDGKMVLDVDVTEKSTGTFSVGLGYSSVDKLMAQGSVSQNNFLGYGIKVDLSGSFGSVSNTYSLGVVDPHFLDTDWTLGGEIYKSAREYDDYDDDRLGGAIRAGHPVTQYSKAYLTYRYEQQEVSNISATVDPNDPWIYPRKSTLSSITGEWIRNSTNNYQDPSTGGITKLSLEYAGIGGTENFVKSIAEHRHFFPLFWGTVFSIHGEVGYVVSTTSDEVSITEKFFLGGIRTIRGFKNREVGPMDKYGNYIGGEKMAYFNFEYLFPLVRDLGLKGVLFYDTGNAWTKDDAYFTDMRHSVGAGVRWESPMGPLRFEWGYNLDPRGDEKDSVFEFTIGKAY